MSLIIETQDLTKDFGHRTAVSHLNLAVERGDIFGFLGQNGAGKSTTLRMLLGLVKPSSGRILLQGLDVARNREAALKRVGAIVEAPAFYDNLSGIENLRLFSSLSGGALPSRIHEVLGLAGLSGREHDKVGIYSHGMRQRLGLAQALLPKPELLILDEPTDGLDPQGIREIRSLLVDLCREEKITIFLSSHLLHEIERICSKVAIIDRGRLLYQGPLSQLLGTRQLYRIRTDRPEEAFQFLSYYPEIRISRNGDHYLYFEGQAHEMAFVNQTLVGHGFRVFEIAPRMASLEEVYFQLTAC